MRFDLLVPAIVMFALFAIGLELRPVAFGAVRRRAGLLVPLPAVVLATLGWTSAPAQRSDALSRYHRIVVHYREAKFDLAAAEVAGITASQLLRSVRDLRESFGDLALRGSAGHWDDRLLAAALVMHIDIYIAGAKKGQLVPAHIDCALALLELYSQHPADSHVRDVSALAIAWLLQVTGQFEIQRGLISAALQRNPRDSRMLIARGVMEESAASPRYRGSDRGARRGLEAAEKSYRAALDADPDAVEGRIRLGYVLLRLGRIDEAQRQLTLALSQTSPARLTYLAELFKGAAHGLAGDVPDALAAYERANAAAPQCQVAAIALANTHRLLGHDDLAREIARTAALPVSAPCDDPWWSYDYGEAWQLDDAIDRLRGRVQR